MRRMIRLLVGINGDGAGELDKDGDRAGELGKDGDIAGGVTGAGELGKDGDIAGGVTVAGDGIGVTRRPGPGAAGSSPTRLTAPVVSESKYVCR